MKIPFADVRPVPFFLGFVEIGVEIDDKLFDKALPEKTGLEFRPFPSSLEFEVLFFLDISSNSGRHSCLCCLSKLIINDKIKFIYKIINQVKTISQTAQNIKYHYQFYLVGLFVLFWK